MVYSLKIEHVEEEIARLNIEVSCLQTFISDEESEFDDLISQIQVIDPLLCRELYELCDCHRQVNMIHRCMLRKLFQLPGFSGSTQLGVSVGKSCSSTTSGAVPLYGCP
jgi:hypothetical protein